MKAKYELPPLEKARLEIEEAYRLGYTAGASGSVDSRDLCPLTDLRLRRHWRAGFDLGAGKGLKITLPKLVYPHSQTPSKVPGSAKRG